MDRLARKFETARNWMPEPVVEINRKASIGIIAYGTTHWAIVESRDQLLAEADLQTSYYRLCAYPFRDALMSFIERYDRVYVVEQNRDAQMLSLMKLDVRPGWPTGCGACCTTPAIRSTRAPSPTASSSRKATVEKAGAQFARLPHSAGVGGE